MKKVEISEQVLSYINKYSEGTGINRDELINLLLFSDLSSENSDFVYCPVCKNPTAYIPVISVQGEISFECKKCGYGFKKEI
ncbi:MAG: hypothetical protein LBT27_05860 [Prevotellaceae bacterium]|jgi:rubredoxin|nr:hypothetical protein [Prevotellaceae bacterium]